MSRVKLTEKRRRNGKSASQIQWEQMRLRGTRMALNLHTTMHFYTENWNGIHHPEPGFFYNNVQ
jgi:hypothetical protein